MLQETFKMCKITNDVQGYIFLLQFFICIVLYFVLLFYIWIELMQQSIYADLGAKIILHNGDDDGRLLKICLFFYADQRKHKT